jgi:hypothetical protein
MTDILSRLQVSQAELAHLVLSFVVATPLGDRRDSSELEAKRLLQNVSHVCRTWRTLYRSYSTLKGLPSPFVQTYYRSNRYDRFDRDNYESFTETVTAYFMLHLEEGWCEFIEVDEETCGDIFNKWQLKQGIGTFRLEEDAANPRQSNGLTVHMEMDLVDSYRNRYGQTGCVTYVPSREAVIEPSGAHVSKGQQKRTKWKTNYGLAYVTRSDVSTMDWWQCRSNNRLIEYGLPLPEWCTGKAEDKLQYLKEHGIGEPEWRNCVRTHKYTIDDLIEPHKRLQIPTIPLAELVKKPRVSDILQLTAQAGLLEVHLSDEEWTQTFGCANDRRTFYTKVPKWKQLRLKQENSLW